MKNISYRTLSIQLSAIKAMERKAREKENLLSLAQGIPYFPTPPAIAHRVAESIMSGEASYYTIPDGLPSLRQAISRDIEERSGTHYDPQREILVTAGAMAAIQALLLTLLNPGDEVMVISPAYASYYGQINTACGVPRSVPMDPEKDFRLDMEELHRSVTPKTKAILFANPSNPTGTNFTKEELQSICDFAIQEDLYLISDEVYRDFVWEGEHISCASFPEVKARLFVVFGFSKAYAMTGYRVGYLCGPASVLEHTLKFHDNMVTCAPHPAQIAAQAALEEPAVEMEKRMERLKASRERVLELLKETPFLTAHKPQGAYYIFAKIDRGQVDSFAFCQYLLEEAGVATVPGIAFGPEVEGYLRICYAVPEERIERAFERLRDLYKRGIDFEAFEVPSSLRRTG